MNPEEMRAREEFFCQDDRQKKPPLGLRPRWICDDERASDIRVAIGRYLEYGCKPIPIEWIEEYNEIIKRSQEGERLDGNKGY